MMELWSSGMMEECDECKSFVICFAVISIRVILSLVISHWSIGYLLELMSGQLLM